MSALQLIDEYRRLGAEFFIDDDGNLKMGVVDGCQIDDGLIEKAKQHKAEIARFLIGDAENKLTEAAQSLHINPDDALQLYRDDLEVIADMPTDTVKAYLQDALDNGKLSRKPKAPVIPVDEYVLTAALRVLQQLYQQHRARLVAGGYSPDGARVKMLTWRAQCHSRGITESRLKRAVDELVKRGKVMIRHGYAYRADHE